MTPDYIEQLAKAADPQQLWRLSPFEQQKLPEPLRRQLDTGVALRRHAEHVLRLRSLVGTGRSLLLTPIAENGTDVRVVASRAANRTPPVVGWSQAEFLGALKLIAAQDEGVGGTVTEAEAWRSAQRLARAAIAQAELAAKPLRPARD